MQDGVKIDSPFEFIAAIMEIKRALGWEKKHGSRYDYPSGHPISFDASTSGCQILAALARDEKSGALCNLTDSSDRGDYYGAISTEIWAEMEPPIQEQIDKYNEFTETLSNFEDEGEKKAYLYQNARDLYDVSTVFWSKPSMVRLQRKLVKRSCMTLLYSAQPKTMSKQLFGDFASEPGFEELTPAFCFYLCVKIYQKCREVLDIPVKLMDLFIDIGISEYKKGKHLEIIAPYTKFKFKHFYRTSRKEQIRVWHKNKPMDIKISVENNSKLSYKKVKSSTSPNVVHMLDSQLVAKVLLETDYDIMAVHDCWATTPANAGKLFEDTRTAFYELFSEDILKNILTQKGLESWIKEDGVIEYTVNNKTKRIEYGNLDVKDVLDNDWAFC